MLLDQREQQRGPQEQRSPNRAQAAAAAPPRLNPFEEKLRSGLARFHFVRDDPQSDSDESCWGEDSTEPQASREQQVSGRAGGGWVGGAGEGWSGGGCAGMDGCP
jgi:hypothetical protein